MQEMQVQSVGRDDPLEEEPATHSSILAWETSWTEEPGRLQSTGSQKTGQNLVTKHQTSSPKQQPQKIHPQTNIVKNRQSKLLDKILLILNIRKFLDWGKELHSVSNAPMLLRRNPELRQCRKKEINKALQSRIASRQQLCTANASHSSSSAQIKDSFLRS